AATASSAASSRGSARATRDARVPSAGAASAAAAGAAAVARGAVGAEADTSENVWGGREGPGAGPTGSIAMPSHRLERIPHAAPTRLPTCVAGVRRSHDRAIGDGRSATTGRRFDRRRRAGARHRPATARPPFAYRRADHPDGGRGEEAGSVGVELVERADVEAARVALT